LNRYQSGFRSGHSTTTALLKITDDIGMDMDNNLMSILALLDFSTLKEKIGNIYQSCIEINKPSIALSSFLPVTQGVPQGSILGPLLFSLFINDISSCIKFSNYHIYADDAQIYLSGSRESIASVISQINSDLASVPLWSTENGLCLNSQKT
jgi:Reverse transcriptase (RNA-dependent DNA polymerase)